MLLHVCAGRFGCIKDCGRYLNTTKIYVNLRDLFADVKQNDAWDLSRAGAVTSRSNPQFKWNIYSE
jgi:hypothetical protein